MRIFAGPNGSGKSTVIDWVRKQTPKGHPIDFGYYINADEIGKNLLKQPLDFKDFDIQCTPKEFAKVALSSGLINKEYTHEQFLNSYFLRGNRLHLKDKSKVDYLAQVTADFLRKKMLELRKRFSFETVFSHVSKVDIMKEAVKLGYKVYLYFVSTSSPEINKFRVLARVAKGGHDVNEDKIVSRYYRSMDLLYNAAQFAYQAFFFDNSREGEHSVLFAHFKQQGGNKKWDSMNENEVPDWFIQYYSQKISNQ